MSLAKNTDTFTGVATGQPVRLHGKFNVGLSGFGAGTVALERSFDGTTWYFVDSWAADVQKSGEEPEIDVLYRLNCTAYSSGTILGRLSQ